MQLTKNEKNELKVLMMDMLCELVEEDYTNKAIAIYAYAYHDLLARIYDGEEEKP